MHTNVHVLIPINILTLAFVHTCTYTYNMAFYAKTLHLSIHLPSHLYTHLRIEHMAHSWDSALHDWTHMEIINTHIGPWIGIQSIGTPSVFSYLVSWNSLDRKTRNMNLYLNTHIP